MKKYVTKQRRALCLFLEANADAMFSAGEIYKALKDEKISLSAIYRNLPILESEGLINRVAMTGSTEIYYQSIDSQRCCSSIHLNCTECGKSQHLAHNAALSLKDSALTASGFEVDATRTVIYGKCRNCKSNF